MIQKNKILLVPALIIIMSIFVAIGITVQAASKDDILFPVAELNNCASEWECKAYCDEPENILVCVEFAEKHNLMSHEEAEVARKFSLAGEGPGGCASHESCETYCNDINNIDECLAFAEEHGIMPEEELEEAKKIQAALASGAHLPGGCTNKNECEAYCEDPNHMEECIAFAEAAGFMPPDELEDAKKAVIVIKKGIKPPDCRGKEECDVYCSEPENFEVCINFAEAAGFMSSEEAEMVRKTGGKGPGGCKGKEECDAFCNDPTHQEECFKFAQEHGLISEEDLHRMEEGRQKMLEGINSAPLEVQECLISELGSDFIEGIKDGTAMPSEEAGNKMRYCFEKMAQKMMKEEMMEEMHDLMPHENMMPEGDMPHDDMMEHEDLPMPIDLPTDMQNFQQPPNPEDIDDLKHEIEEQIQEQIMEQMMPPSDQTPGDDGMTQELDALEKEIFEEMPALDEVLEDVPIDSIGGLLIKILSPRF